MRRILRIIVHHSAGPDTTSAETIDRQHRAQGWSGIGYHYLIRRLDGGPWTVEAGRPEERAGAHDQGANADSLGICLAGNYAEMSVPAEAWTVLVATVADRCRVHGLTERHVEGHGEHEPAGSATRCPGFSSASLRLAVARQLAL